MSHRSYISVSREFDIFQVAHTRRNKSRGFGARGFKFTVGSSRKPAVIIYVTNLFRYCSSWFTTPVRPKSADFPTGLNDVRIFAIVRSFDNKRLK